MSYGKVTYLNIPLTQNITTINSFICQNCYGTHQVLAYADDVNLIGDDIRTIKRNADVLLNACKDIGLAVNIGKTKYRK